MVNTFLTPDVIAREALALLQSNMVATNLFSRNYETDLNAGAKVGDTIRVRRRANGTVDTYGTNLSPGSTITVRDIEETSINMTLERHFDASIRITDKDRTLELAQFSEQVLAPRMIEMGEVIDTYALTKLLDVAETADWNGVASTSLIDSIADMAQVEKRANDLKWPGQPRLMIMSTTLKATLLGVTSFVEVDKSGADSALRLAEFGPLMGFRGFMGQNVPTTTHTTGTGVTAAVSADVAAGATAIPYDTSAGATDTWLTGDIVTIAGYGNVVLAASTTSVSNAGTLTITEPLREAVADTTGLTLYDGGGNDYQTHGVIFHPEGLAFVSVPLELPTSAQAAYIRDEATGLSVRAVFDYDRDLKADVLSLDILVGALMADGRKCARIIQGV